MNVAGRSGEEVPVLFLVGSGRGGTTVIYEAICSHPAAGWISNYSQRFPPAARLHPRRPMASKESGTRYLPRPVEGYRIFDAARHGRGASAGCSTLDGILGKQDLSARERTRLRRAVAQHVAPRHVEFFVNKNTRNTRRVGYLAAAFPEARFVHVVRHPLAAVASLLAVDFFDDIDAWWLPDTTVADLVDRGSPPELVAAEIWARETSACTQALSTIPADVQLLLHYERFATDPEASAAEILCLVDETLTPAVTRLLASRGVSNRNATSIGRVSAEQQARVWERVSDIAEAHGYRVDDPEGLHA